MNLLPANRSLCGVAIRQPLSSGRPGTEPRPLMPLSAVMTWLDLDEDEVKALIDQGALL